MPVASSMSRTQAAKLANEIEANRPIQAWDTNSELKKFKAKIQIKSGDTKTMNFEDMVTKYKDLSAEIEYRESIQRQLKEQIETAVLVSGEDAVSCSGYKVQRITKQGAKKLNQEKLLLKGVSALVIAECTDVGKESSYVSITKIKESRE